VAVVFLVTLIVIACALVGISGTLRRIEAHNARFEPTPPEESPLGGCQGTGRCACNDPHAPDAL
jgi:hypothetical protein